MNLKLNVEKVILGKIVDFLGNLRYFIYILDKKYEIRIVLCRCDHGAAHPWNLGHDHKWAKSVCDPLSCSQSSQKRAAPHRYYLLRYINIICFTYIHAFNTELTLIVLTILLVGLPRIYA